MTSRHVFSKSIAIDGEPEGRSFVVSAHPDCTGLITIEIVGDGGPTPQSETIYPSEARKIAAALITAADRADRAWDAGQDRWSPARRRKPSASIHVLPPRP